MQGWLLSQSLRPSQARGYRTLLHSYHLNAQLCTARARVNYRLNPGAKRSNATHANSGANPPKPKVNSNVSGKSGTPAEVEINGCIHMRKNEGLLFFDNVFPLKTAIWDLRQLLMRFDRTSVTDRLTKLVPPNLPFTIESIIPRLKDGGAFLKFSYSVSNTTPKEIEKLIARHLEKSNVRPWFAPIRRLRSYLVEGRPWLEDLYRFPSTRIRVEFIGGTGDLSQERLYNLFRKYGKIAEIIPQSQANKDLPRYAVIQFLRIRSATAAKNCLHRARVTEEGVGDIILRIGYERRIKGHYIRDWLVNHPRIVIPAAAAIIATVTVAIFDPIRTWFIKAKITRSLHLSENKYWSWLVGHTVGYLTPFSQKRKALDDDISTLLEERKGIIELLKNWLLDTAETFIVVQGPRGSGKRELVLNYVIPDRRNVLIVDCEPIVEAHGDSATIAAAAMQVGYRPVFSWMNTISSLLDLAAQGTIGTSAGFSQTLETQFNKILQTTAAALRSIALTRRSPEDRDSHLSDEEYLSAHPEVRPTIIIDNFLHTPEGTMIYDRLADWAALLVSANVANVIFLTNDVSFSKSLAKALPDRIFRSVLLGDASPESAKRYVLGRIEDIRSERDKIPRHKNTKNNRNGDGSNSDLPHLHPELKDRKPTPEADGLPDSEKSTMLEKELDESIAVLGGRLTDLEFLATRICSGEGPSHAVHEIIEVSAAEIIKLYLSSDDSDVAAKAGGEKRSRKKWTVDQAWWLIKQLANTTTDEALRYNEILLHDLFKSAGGEDCLSSLEQSELIAVLSSNGRPHGIKPGKPVYKAAFQRLLKDEALHAKLDLAVLERLCKIEVENIKKCEDELLQLGQLPKQPSEVARRADYLVKKLGASQAKVEEYEGKMGGLKKVLKEKY